MSNPAVISLGNSQVNGKILKIEDNIGEAIHIHYDNARIDLTIYEFFVFAKMIEESLQSLLEIENFNLSNFDPIYLGDLNEKLYDLQKVCYEKIYLSQLQIIRKNFLGLPMKSNIKKSRVYRAINRETKENDEYIQENYYGNTNRDRVRYSYEQIKKSGYPLKEEYIVLINNQYLIMDGQHRASALFHIFGNIEIPIIRLVFKDNKYNVRRFIVLNAIKNNLKIIFKKVIRKIMKLKNGLL
jgi:hypothetical protein